MDITKDEPIIPTFNLLFFMKVKFIHSSKYFFLCEAKTVSILFRSRGNYFYVVKIRKK